MTLTGFIKRFLDAKTGIPGITVGRLALLIAIPFSHKFLKSEAFQNLKNLFT